MDILSAILIILGLCVFETVSGIDNAIVNADVLSSMKEWARKWFLVWGLLIAVFVVRGLVPWLIVWASAPSLGPIGALTATFSGDGTAAAAIEASAPFLLIGGGVFMALLFLHWLVVERKNSNSWFIAISAILLLVLIFLSVNLGNPGMAVSSAVGFAVFFVITSIRSSADRKLGSAGDVSKLVLLEVIDASFSVDAVVGAFAFTMSVPLILIGNGLGALVVRQLTVKNIDTIKRFVHLKTGAMFSILCLSIVMCAEAFGIAIPMWITPVVTITIVGISLLLSIARAH